MTKGVRIKEKEEMKSEKIETSKFFIWIDENIVFLEYKLGIEVEVEDIKEYNNAILELGKGRKLPLLVDAREGASISPEARLYAASAVSTNLKLASAIVVNTLPNKLIANFYINFNKPLIPSKVFTSMAEAVEWLKQY